MIVSILGFRYTVVVHIDDSTNFLLDSIFHAQSGGVYTLIIQRTGKEDQMHGVNIGCTLPHFNSLMTVIIMTIFMLSLIHDLLTTTTIQKTFLQDFLDILKQLFQNF